MTEREKMRNCYERQLNARCLGYMGYGCTECEFHTLSDSLETYIVGFTDGLREADKRFEGVLEEIDELHKLLIERLDKLERRL